MGFLLRLFLVEVAHVITYKIGKYVVKGFKASRKPNN